MYVVTHLCSDTPQTEENGLITITTAKISDKFLRESPYISNMFSRESPYFHTKSHVSNRVPVTQKI